MTLQIKGRGVDNGAPRKWKKLKEKLILILGNFSPFSTRLIHIHSKTHKNKELARFWKRK